MKTIKTKVYYMEGIEPEFIYIMESCGGPGHYIVVWEGRIYTQTKRMSAKEAYEIQEVLEKRSTPIPDAFQQMRERKDG